MVYKKAGYPVDGEIVLCTVKKILKNTVFVSLDEYEQQEGIIHISEISPGRIRTIRDYVKENKKVVCKVLRRNLKYNNIELSIRRVTTGQKIKKLQEVKLESKAENVLTVIAKKHKEDPKDFFKKIAFPIRKEFGSLFRCFQEIVETNEDILAELGIEKKIANEITEVVKVRFKQQEVQITRKMVIHCPAEDGIVVIRDALQGAQKAVEKSKYNMQFSYVSAPEYALKVTADTYKEAEEEILEITEDIAKTIKKHKGTFELEKGSK